MVSVMNEQDMLDSIDRALTRTAPLPVPAAAAPAALPRVSIIIPVLNDAAGLARCLASIGANGYPDSLLEVIVADNGSVDGSPEVAVRNGARVVRLAGLSVAAVRNRVAEMANGDVLAFVDADHELDGGWLESAVDALAGVGVGAAGAPYHPPGDATWVQQQYDAFRTHSSEPTDTRWLGSGNLAVWKRAFIETGGFDTSLTTCEDVDFCQRLRATGFRLVADERLRSVHHGDPRTLRQLFISELWRGRDNLAVSFRTKLHLRDLPSVLIPIVVLASLFALPVAIVAAMFGMPLPLVAALGLTTAPPAARAFAMAQRQPAASRDFARAFVVASTYDVARALALVVRKSHRRVR
jgi:GT2 family glycosyltransferase